MVDPMSDRSGRFSSQASSVAALLGLLALGGLGASSCGGAPAPAEAPKAPSAAAGSAAAKAQPGGKKAPGPVEMVTPSLLLPDLTGERGVVAMENGQRRVLVDRMRLIAHEDGSVERGEELLPMGAVASIELPARLGGGYLFQATTGGNTQLWRASSWLGRLEPLVTLGAVASEIVPGFDRLYVRLAANNKLQAVSPQTGELMSLAPLPPAAGYGVVAFADGWRAVVDTDLRGPLATFDAGVTWRPVGIRERVTSIPINAGDPLIQVNGGHYRIDARGGVTFRADAPREPGAPEDDDIALQPRPAGPFGKRPLRAAVEDGWPDSKTTAVVARGGALARISLKDGAVLALAEDAYPDRQASCHALRFGSSFGFVCGERDGATRVYAFAPPLSMREIIRWKRPRFVASSGNGALVARGVCGDDAPMLVDTRAYCILDKEGKTREIRVKGEQLGFERVIALADGRVAVLVPPRAGTSGQLTVLAGTATASALLRLPAEPRSVARELKRGMWLEGFEEREPGVLGGWVEAGGPVIGVRVSLDGKVKAGNMRYDAGGAVIAGRFGLSVGEGGRAAESTDGGMTWNAFDLPDRDEDDVGSKTRACGPVGCAIKGWLRVGWGKARGESDLASASQPPSQYNPIKASPSLAFDCKAAGSVTPPLPVKKMASVPVVKAPVIGRRREVSGSIWMPFRNTPPPTLQNDEIGLDQGAPFDLVSMRAYAWGRKGADWTRAGRWLIRFDDRFDPGGGVRSSSASASPWIDEAAAAEALGTTSYGLSWGAYLDPSGRAALAHSCRGSGCSLFAVADGQPVLPLRDASGRTSTFYRPFPHGAVRVGEAWFFVTVGPSYDSVALWRADLGVSRQIALFYRPTQGRYATPDPPRLVRRALGGVVGILVASAPDPGERTGSWYVLPLNPDTGELGEATPLVRKDLAGMPLTRCAAGQDGWLFDTALESTPVVDLEGGYASLDSVELRLRVDPGAVCVESMAARIDGTYSQSSGGQAAAGGRGAPASVVAAAPPAGGDDGSRISLAATEKSSGRRWIFQCGKRGPLSRR